MLTMVGPSLALNPEERDILAGRTTALQQRLLQTLVLFAEALRAPRLAEITAKGHFVITHALPGLSPSLDLLEQLLAADCRTRFPFTLDPPAPLDFDNWWLTADQIAALQRMYTDQDRYLQCMDALGLWSRETCTCTPYLPEIGNIPKKGDILAWSESACVVFANSVLGARSNRNGAIMDLLSNIIGKTPYCGLLTDAGRRATMRITMNTRYLPLPQLLGAAIGRLVMGEVGYIIGLDRWLGQELTPMVRDYLHEMGAASAATGGVGLFHVERLTPEAVEQGRDLLTAASGSAVIDDQHLHTVRKTLACTWNVGTIPDKCFLGCPQLSLQQVQWWAEALLFRLASSKARKLKIRTTISAAPEILERFKNRHPKWSRLIQSGVRFSPGCPMQLFDNDLSAGEQIVTNSVKLSTYTEARYVDDQDLVQMLVSGKQPEGL